MKRDRKSVNVFGYTLFPDKSDKTKFVYQDYEDEFEIVAKFNRSIVVDKVKIMITLKNFNKTFSSMENFGIPYAERYLKRALSKTTKRNKRMGRVLDRIMGTHEQ